MLLMLKIRHIAHDDVEASMLHVLHAAYSRRKERSLVRGDCLCIWYAELDVQRRDLFGSQVLPSVWGPVTIVA